jgi:hypothetical protein
METYLCFLLGPPFPLMGKGRNRGAREPRKPITPTLVPGPNTRQGEGIYGAAAVVKYRYFDGSQRMQSEEVAVPRLQVHVQSGGTHFIPIALIGLTGQNVDQAPGFSS